MWVWLPVVVWLLPDFVARLVRQLRLIPKKQPTASHPSVKGRRPQERWIGAHWESQETPVAQLPSFGFGPRYRLPAFCL